MGLLDPASISPTAAETFPYASFQQQGRRKEISDLYC